MAEITCAICLDNLKKNYATFDHIADMNTKCCIKCLKKWYKINKISLISRVPVSSYTIYTSSGNFYEKVPLDKIKRYQRRRRRRCSMHDPITFNQAIVASLKLIWLLCCIFMILFSYWYQ